MLKLYYFLIFKRTLINVYYFFQVSVPELIKKQNFLKKNSIYLLVELFIVRVFYSNYFFRNLKKSKFLIYKKNDDQKLFQERYNTHQIQTETFSNFEKKGFEELGNLDSLFLEKLKEEIFPGISKYNNQTGYYKSLIENESTQTGRLIIKPNKNKIIKKNMSNARDNRFEGMIKMCKKKNILHLFLGHHSDDNLETFLMRKINGSNLDGLESINKNSYFKGIQILRPLIEIDKKSILSFNKNNKIQFISDPTNKDLNYTRVMIRNFLQNNIYKKEIKKDFFSIKKQIPNYKKMIWEILIDFLISK